MNSILGLVLAGGASTRLGQPKQYLKLHGEQAPDMLSHTVSLVAECAHEVRVSCRQGDNAGENVRLRLCNSSRDSLRDSLADGIGNSTYDSTECGDSSARGDTSARQAPPAAATGLAPRVSLLPDIFDGFGPMSGIHAGLTALQRSPHEALLVLPCDLPFMTKDVLQRLIECRHATKKVFPDLLMTTYRQSHTGYIEALVSVYERECLPYFHQSLVENRRQINLIIPEERIVDIVYTPAEARPFFNINFPEELAQVCLYMRARGLQIC